MTHTDLNATSDSTAGAPAADLDLRRPHRGEDTAPRAGARAGLLERLTAATPLLGRLFLLGIVACTLIIVLDAAAATSPLVPKSPKIATWLNGPGSQLDYKTFLWTLLVMSACYIGAALCRPGLSARWVIGTIVTINVILFIGPVLLSQDIFQYIAYGRLGIYHGLNPFQNGPAAAHLDPIFKYVSRVWWRVPSAYGPMFTLISYPIVLLGIDGAVWGMKLVATVSSLVAVGFVWLCAKRLGRDPVLPTLLVALNPLWTVYGLGGFHNDLLMDALMMAGVWLTLRGQDARGAAAVVVAAAVKATAVVVLPFMLLARRRVTLIWGALAALAMLAVVVLAVFGVHGLDFVSVLRRNAQLVSSDSFPNEVAHLIGFPGVYKIDRTLIDVVTAFVLLWLLWRTWRGYDWISGAAWALLILAVTTTWLLGWYLLWALPLAVLARDKRVWWATAAVMALFIVHQTSPLFSPAQ